MKLSSFKLNSLAKKLQYINGEPKLVEYDKLDGDINFYSLDDVLLNKIGTELSVNTLSDDQEEIFMYKLLPYLCDIEVDITLEEFKQLIKSTNKNFIKFIEIIMSLVNDCLSMANSIENIQATSKNIAEKTNIVVETDEDKLERLYGEVDNASNRNEKRRLMRDITALEEKMNLNA